jgi:hypothetical protein
LPILHTQGHRAWTHRQEGCTTMADTKRVCGLNHSAMLSGVSCLVVVVVVLFCVYLARPARSFILALMLVSPRLSLWGMMGVMRPVGVATATLMSTLPFSEGVDFLLQRTEGKGRAVSGWMGEGRERVSCQVVGMSSVFWRGGWGN